ncbi:pentatricopeptide repeat-containing protein At1g11290, chloroplastic-like [Nymphaea colorata]|nr:pentatricopeptide repeat-containing protein At1g11290, chloroplastic-like [Nymphaea colorata]
MRAPPHQLISGGLVVPPFPFRRHLLSLVSADPHYALCTFNNRTTNHGCSLALAFLCPVVIETLHRSLSSSPSLRGHAADLLCSRQRKDVPSSKMAVELVVETLINGDKADGTSLVGAVVAAARLRNPRLGRWAHGIAVKGWMPWDPHLGSALVGMYGKCGCLDDSHQAFVEMPERNLVCCNAMMDAFARSGELESARRIFDYLGARDIVSWNTMIGGYARWGLAGEALRLFRQLLLEVDGLEPNKVTFFIVFLACTCLKDVELGRQVHGLVVVNQMGSSIGICNALVDMYSKCGRLDLSWQVFDRMPERDIVSWNTMLASFVRGKCFFKALKLFVSMQAVGFTRPDEFSMVSVINACALLKEWSLGKSSHACIEKMGMVKDGILCNSLIGMYANCGFPEDALKVFRTFPCRDLVSWNTMLNCYVDKGFPVQALSLFHDMQMSNFKPDKITLVSLTSACSQLGDGGVSRCLHGYIIRTPAELDTVVYNSVITMYARCCCLNYACRIFHMIDVNDRNVSTWSAMIGALATHGKGMEALELFSEMRKIGPQPDDITFMEVLSACRHSG